jgi:hypothetical protein
MAQFIIRYGVGGGYNDIQTEVLESDNLREAERYAYEGACEMFESYGVFNDSYPDYDYSSEDYEAEYNEELERWIEYSARPID